MSSITALAEAGSEREDDVMHHSIDEGMLILPLLHLNVTLQSFLMSSLTTAIFKIGWIINLYAYQLQYKIRKNWYFFKIL